MPSSEQFGASYLYLNEGRSSAEVIANNGPRLNGVATNASLRLYVANVAFFNNNYEYWLLPMTRCVGGEWVGRCMCGRANGFEWDETAVYESMSESHSLHHPPNQLPTHSLTD